MSLVFLALLACGGSEAPEAAPVPEATPEPKPAHAKPAPVITTPEQLSPKGGPKAYDPATFETLHGGYGSLPSPGASSTLAPQGDNAYDVGKLDDDSPFTAWVEGVDGDGVGQTIDFTWGCGEQGWTSSGMISLLNGYQKSAQAFADNGRVKQLELSVDGQVRAFLNLEDRTGEQNFTVPVNVGDKVRLTIRSTYAGAKYQDTALSEIWVSCGP